MNSVELRAEIAKKYGTTKRFAKILEAPYRTIESWVRPHKPCKPSDWVREAAMDAVHYRDKRVSGWRCRNCDTLTIGPESGRKPNNCMSCCSKYLTPVYIVEREVEK